MARREQNSISSASLCLHMEMVNGASVNKASSDYLLLTFRGRQDYDSVDA